MIRARLRLPNSEQTVMRQGTALIDACLAQGCVIVHDINNRWPDGLYDAHVEQSETKASNGSTVKTPPTGEPVGQEPRREKRQRIRRPIAAVAALFIAAATYAQTPISDIQPLSPDSITPGQCFTYMPPFGQYTHPDIGPFVVAVVRDERTGRFYTVRLAPGAMPKEGELMEVTKEGAL